MVPLGFCSLALFYLIFHCVRETQRNRFFKEDSIPRLESLIRQRDLQSAYTILEAQNTVLGRAFSHALLKARVDLDDGNKTVVEANLTENP